MGRSPTDFKSVVYAIPPLAQNGLLAYPTPSPWPVPCLPAGRRHSGKVPLSKIGGANRSRTGLRGFADLCLTARPSRQNHISKLSFDAAYALLRMVLRSLIDGEQGPKGRVEPLLGHRANPSTQRTRPRRQFQSRDTLKERNCL